MIQQTNQKKKQTYLSNDSILESMRDVGGGVVKTVAKDVVGKVAQQTLASILGSPIPSGEMRPNQPIDFAHEQQPQPQTHSPEMSHRPVSILREEHDLKQRIDAVRQELKMLSQSIKKLNTEIDKAITETPVNPGVYHMNFMERLRNVLMTLREHIEDSATWLATSNSRKSKKGYWGMYKKHGTKFGLSSERTMATQAG